MHKCVHREAEDKLKKDDIALRTMSEESTDKTIAKFVFSGKKIDWPIWSEKFLARAKRKEYKNILLGRVNVPDDSKTIDTSTDAGKAEAKLRDLNELAYEDLILFINGSTDAGRIAFSIIRNSKTSDLKDGDSALAWKAYVTSTSPRQHLLA